MIVVIDIGSSSVRGMAVNSQGIIEKKIQERYPLQVIGSKTVLSSPETVMSHIYDILGLLGKWLSARGKIAAGIAVTGQRSSVIPVTAQGKALSAAMSWQDGRAEGICSRFRSRWEEIYKITGVKLSPVFSAPKMLYLKENDIELYDSACKLTGFQEYVLYHLTHRFVTDASVACRTALFDICKKEWSDTLLDMFGISRSKLCPVIQAGGIAGYAIREIAALLGSGDHIPVISAGGDQQCAALGLGCIEMGDLAVNSGTGAFAAAVSDKPIFHPHMCVNCNVSAIPGKWMIEGAVLSAGKSLDWFMKEIWGSEYERGLREIENACLTTPPGANGVIVSPSFGGKGTPKWNAKIRAGIFNLGFANTKEDIARALLEGISAELIQCANTVEELTGKPARVIHAAGGLMQSPSYCRILCDMAGREIHQPDICEATGIGAWISAQVTLGNYGTYKEAFDKYSETVQTTIWRPDSGVTKLYQKMNERRRDYEEILD